MIMECSWGVVSRELCSGKTCRNRNPFYCTLRRHGSVTLRRKCWKRGRYEITPCPTNCTWTTTETTVIWRLREFVILYHPVFISVYSIYCHVLKVCVSYRRVWDWIIGFIDTLYIVHLQLHANTAPSLFPHFTVLRYTYWCSQSSLVVSWQRIYNSLTVTAARYEVFLPFLPCLLNYSANCQLRRLS
jgi:hypothetical protein